MRQRNKEPMIITTLVSRSFLLMFVLLSTILNAWSQDNYFEIKSIYSGKVDTHGLDGGIAIPLIIDKNNPLIAKKINETIQMKYLHGLYSEEGKNVFENFQKDSYNVSLDYSIDHNSKDLLSISFEIEALRTSYSYLNFNPKTGEFISISDLFTTSGLDNISQKVKENFKIRIYDFLKNCLTDRTLSEDELNQIKSYIECNSYQINFEDYQFSFDKVNIYLKTGDCLNVDNIGWSAFIKLESINCTDLTETGRILLSKCAEIKTTN
jgi:hypothetical protein